MTSSKTRQSLDGKDKPDKSAKAKPEGPPTLDSEPAALPSLDDPSLYINRELGLLAFQRRVLEEAQDEENPLLERFKFLSIVGSNIEEFFMVRVAGLKRQLESGLCTVGSDGLTPLDQLEAVRLEVKSILDDGHHCFVHALAPALEQANIRIHKYEELSGEQRSQVQAYFLQTIFPVLTPLAFDPGHPFPHISNLSLNLAILILDDKGEERFARVKVPDTLPQLIAVDRAGVERCQTVDLY